MIGCFRQKWFTPLRSTFFYSTFSPHLLPSAYLNRFRHRILNLTGKYDSQNIRTLLANMKKKFFPSGFLNHLQLCVLFCLLHVTRINIRSRSITPTAPHATHVPNEISLFICLSISDASHRRRFSSPPKTPSETLFCGIRKIKRFEKFTIQSCRNVVKPIVTRLRLEYVNRALQTNDSSCIRKIFFTNFPETNSLIFHHGKLPRQVLGRNQKRNFSALQLPAIVWHEQRTGKTISISWMMYACSNNKATFSG